MSKPTGTVLSLPAFLGGSRRTREVEVIHPITYSNLEVLAEVIKTMRSHKIIADAEFIKAEARAMEAAEELNEAIDAYEAEVAERGLLCRK